MVVPDAPPLPKDFSTSPTVHTPKRAAHKIEQGIGLDSSKDRTTGYKAETPITVGPKRLLDSPFPKRSSPTPYRRPGTPYRKVDPSGTEESPETLGAENLAKPDNSFEIDSESQKTLTQDPKTPKVERSISGMPEGITKRKVAPTILPFSDKGAKSKIESKAIVRLKKIDAKVDIEKRPLGESKTLREKVLETKVEEKKKPTENPEKGPIKNPEESTKKPHEKLIKEAVVAPPAPTVRSPVRAPSPISPVRTSSSSWSPPSSVPSSPVSPVVVGPVAMGTVEEIKNALIESNRVAAMPIPQFYGKKGEKPEDHIMKVEDYFQNYNIRDEAQKCNRFRDTCCGKARTWLSTLTEYPTIFDPEAAPDEAAKAKTMKSMFLARWQLKGRTPQTLYMEWQNLKFDPAKDDIEDFCNDVKNLANRLGYPEDAQVMAIKATLPPVLVTQVINVKTFKEIRDTLITLVENPVIKRVLLTEGTGEKGLAPFSQMQWQPENDVGMSDAETRQIREEGRKTPKSLGKIINKIDSLEMKMRKMSISDEKGKEPPYKPQVAPPRRRGGGKFRGSGRNPKPALTTSSRGPSGFRRNNGRPQGNFQSNSSRGSFRGRFQRNGFRGRGRFDKSPNVSRPRVASRTVSRDSTRCFYCKEPGHISRFCDRREEDERRLKRGSNNMMANIDSQFETDEGYENYDDLYDEQMEYLNN